MKVVEARGTHRRIGQAIGEHLRAEIRAHIAGFVRSDAPGQAERIALFRRSTERHLPQVFEQLEGVAQGADIPLREVLALNLPAGVGEWMPDPQCCTNVAFSQGPDGPLWGKNNDGGFPPVQGPITDARGPRPVALLKLYPDQGLPALCVTFCGWLSGGDMVNAAGVAVGHSSVGSRFQQNPDHVSVLQWMYWHMLGARSARDYVAALASLPLYGKGFTQLVLDRTGTVVAAEIACPLVQLRWPDATVPCASCVNHYQLPALVGLDRRNARGLANSKARQAFLDSLGDDADRSVAGMQRLLRHHGAPSICRHGGDDISHTEYSMIANTTHSSMLVADGNPCAAEYTAYTL